MSRQTPSRKKSPWDFDEPTTKAENMDEALWRPRMTVFFSLHLFFDPAHLSATCGFRVSIQARAREVLIPREFRPFGLNMS